MAGVPLVTSIGTFDPAPLMKLAASAAFQHPGVFEGHVRDGVRWAEPAPRPHLTSMAELLDLSPATISRYMGGGKLRREAADRAAVRLGLHPSNIWPEWFS